jgi:NADH:ubiquinone oxidoreductase subunit K
LAKAGRWWAVTRGFIARCFIARCFIALRGLRSAVRTVGLCITAIEVAVALAVIVRCVVRRCFVALSRRWGRARISRGRLGACVVVLVASAGVSTGIGITTTVLEATIAVVVLRRCRSLLGRLAARIIGRSAGLLVIPIGSIGGGSLVGPHLRRGSAWR